MSAPSRSNLGQSNRHSNDAQRNNLIVFGIEEMSIADTMNQVKDMNVRELVSQLSVAKKVITFFATDS